MSSSNDITLTREEIVLLAESYLSILKVNNINDYLAIDELMSVIHCRIIDSELQENQVKALAWVAKRHKKFLE